MTPVHKIYTDVGGGPNGNTNNYVGSPKNDCMNIDVTPNKNLNRMTPVNRMTPGPTPNKNMAGNLNAILNSPGWYYTLLTPRGGPINPAYGAPETPTKLSARKGM